MQISIRQDYVISSSLVGVELVAACGGRKQNYNNTNKIRLLMPQKYIVIVRGKRTTVAELLIKM